MSRYISIGILVFAVSFILGYVLLGFVETTLDAVLLGTVLIIAMLSVIIALLVKINDLIKKKSVGK